MYFCYEAGGEKDSSPYMVNGNDMVKRTLKNLLITRIKPFEGHEAVHEDEKGP